MHFQAEPELLWSCVFAAGAEGADVSAAPPAVSGGSVQGGRAESGGAEGGAAEPVPAPHLHPGPDRGLRLRGAPAEGSAAGAASARLHEQTRYGKFNPLTPIQINRPLEKKKSFRESIKL